MRCPACYAPNPDSARFCGACGRQLARGCPNCGAAVVAGVRFCTACGTTLDAADLPPAAVATAGPSERRLVSVLFVDLEGFSAIAEQLDPEDVRSLQSRYFEAARAVVARYGGTLEKFIGDAVMAVWGAPTAHEDDAERAVRAGLELVAAVSKLRGPDARRRLAGRAAVATGEAAVAVGAVGQGIVAGDLVNTCARLQALAPPNRVIVDTTTQHTARALAFDRDATVSLRGKTRRVQTWLAAPVEPGQARRADAAHSGPFVGRWRELDELLELIERSSRERRARLVSMVGIAGIGKSRLAWELEQALDAGSAPVALHLGRAPSYGDGITFAPLAEMVRRRARISEGTESEVARRLLAASVAEFVPDELERAWIEPRLAELIDPAASTTYQSDELFAAWRRYFEHVSDWAPVLLVFEDAHWAEPPMLDFVEHLATWSREHPIVTLVLARPELHDSRPSFATGVANHTAIRLEPLPANEIRALVNGIAPDLAPNVVELIVRRAGGVPLYAVEVVRMLLDAGHDGRAGTPGSSAADLPAVPDTLRSLVAARLDALPVPERSLVHAAAVLGHRFHPDALAAVAGLSSPDASSRIAEIVRREVLTLDDDLRSPARGQLSFVQEVVREVAYRTLSRSERRTLHLAAANYLDRLGDEELVEALAEHLFEAASATTDEPPEDPPFREVARRAVDAIVASARRAAALNVPGRALELLQRALSLTPAANEPDIPDDGSRWTSLREEAAVAARAAGRFDVAEPLLRQAISESEARGERRLAAKARALLASVLLSAERHANAIEDLRAALVDLPDAQGDPIGVELLGQLARAQLLVGDERAAIATSRATVRAARRLELHPVALDALITLATARVRHGEHSAGIADLRAVIEEAQPRNLIRAELRARNNLAWLIVLDDPQATLTTARAGMDLAIRMGVGDLAFQLMEIVCAVSVDAGTWDEALGLLAVARDRPDAASHRAAFAAIEATIRGLRGDRHATVALDRVELAPGIDPQVVASGDLARAWFALLDGRFEDAAGLADRAAGPSVAADRVAAVTLAARAALWANDLARARSALEQLSSVDLRGRSVEAAKATIQAGVAARDGNATGAADRYQDAISRWRELEAPLPLALALSEHGAWTGARASAREAEHVLHELGARGALRAVRRLR